jgi:hypothetical protein
MTRIAPLTLWVLLCALLNAAGWLLSAAGWLNATGYGAVFIITGAAAVWWHRRTQPVLHSGFRLRRFRKGFPLAFAIIAALALLGGFLHAPTNYDALAYRTPRVLHWLAEGHWHWIHTDFHRLNTRGSGFEWLTAPLVVFTGSDRLFFLINAVSFLLLPGIGFRLLTGLGVRARVAWHWMWILPGGYCYLLQAGSIGNDLFGSTLAFAAVEYALRAARLKNAALASMAVLAAALATSVKAFNMLLFVPWALAMIPNIGPMLRRPLFSMSMGLLAILVSIVPTSILNHRHSGDWKGLKAEPVKFAAASPGFHLGVNSLLLALHHLNPPVNPLAGAWNKWTERTIPEPWQEKIGQSFEPSVVTFKLGEMQMEESSGLGFGVALLVLAVLLGRHPWRSLPPLRQLPALATRPGNLIPLGAAISVAYFLSQSGLGCPARYLAPFYMLLLAPVLRLSRAEILLKCGWWRGLAYLSFAMGAVLLIVSPPRPLWPAQTSLKALDADKSTSPLLKRVWTVYSVYGDRSDGFEPVRGMLSPEVKTLGLVTFDDPETSLWKPFGSRVIKHVPRSDDAAALRRSGIHHVLVSDYILEVHQNTTIDEWLARYDGEILHSLDLILRAGRGPTRWHLVRIRPDQPAVQ